MVNITGKKIFVCPLPNDSGDSPSAGVTPEILERGYADVYHHSFVEQPLLSIWRMALKCAVSIAAFVSGCARKRLVA